jgi:alpha-beta hydrolase superfamily lysophospholipase
MYHAAWCWRAFQEWFAMRGYDSLALSLRGHGGSDGLANLHTTTLADYAVDVAEVAVSMPKPWVMVGHSLGALAIAGAVESTHPAAIALLAPASAQSFRGVTLKLTCLAPCTSFAILREKSYRPLLRNPKLCGKLFFSPGISKVALRKYVRKLRDESYRAGWQMLLGRRWGCPEYQPLAQTPVLVLGAERDWCVSRCAVKRVAKRLDAQLQWVPGIAHDMMLDTGWKTVAQQMYGWLDKLGLPGVGVT